MLYSVALAGDRSDGGMIEAEAVAKASMEIVKALKGSYLAPDGKHRPVSGDITKAIYAPGLGVVARRLLYNVCAISKDISSEKENIAKDLSEMLTHITFSRSLRPEVVFKMGTL